MATVPAWRLRFANLPGPIDYVAVDQERLSTVEGLLGDEGVREITAFEVVDQRTPRVTYAYGTHLVRLRQPLGERVVLDRGGLPVLCGRAHNTCQAGNG